jgi:zona occludens toxin
MINGIYGKPGGGKSYEAVVSHIIPIVTKDLRKIVTNLPLNIDQFCLVYGDYCRDLIEVVDGQFHNYGGERPFSKKDHYVQYEDWENEKGQKVAFFIDECHLSIPQTGTQKELTEFYSMHRHYGFDIYLITQNFRKVNRDIKDMVQNGYRAIKQTFNGQDHKYILKVHDGCGNTNTSVIATHERTYDKKYFAFYQSHTKSNKSVIEASSNDIEVWWKHWSIKLSVGFFIFFLFIAIKLFYRYTGEDVPLEPEKAPFSKSQAVEPILIEPNILPGKTDIIRNGKKTTTSYKREEPKIIPPKELSTREKEYKEMVANSSTYHPFYKLTLSVSGHYDDIEYGNHVRIVQFSAAQNGQHVFTISNQDLIRAGYDVKILTDCAIEIKYYDYKEFVTCDSPRQGVSLGGESLAKN